jgi:hypothetical protein
MLYQELERLKKQLEEELSWDVAREIASLERELELTNRAVYALSEQARQVWA